MLYFSGTVRGVEDEPVEVITGLAPVRWVDEDGHPWTAFGHWTRRDGRLELSGLELWKDVRPLTRALVGADDRGLAWGEPAIIPAAAKDRDPEGFTAEDLRRIPTAGLARRLWSANLAAESSLRDRLAELAASAEPEARDAAAAWQQLADAAAVFTASSTGGGQGRRNLTDEHLSEVASIYRAALGDPSKRHRPTQAVADEMNTSGSSAAKWVMKARRKGLLTEEPPKQPPKTKPKKKARKR